MKLNNLRLNELFSKKRILFILLFSVIALIGDKINFSGVVGANNQFFTLFQFFGPIAGAFLGPVFGIISVFIAQLANFFLLGKAFNIINIIRLFPMLFAVYYFGNRKKLNASTIVPLICIAAFVLHPIGQQVWFISLYWLIPPIMKLLGDRLIFRSLGATFTAHAVGTSIWLYTVPMTVEQWTGLFPIIAYERILFAIGIAISYVAFNTVLSKAEAIIPSKIINVDSKYVLSKKFFRIQA